MIGTVTAIVGAIAAMLVGPLGGRAFGEEMMELDRVVVTASRVDDWMMDFESEETVLRSSKSVSVISRDMIERSGASNVPELLKSQVGLAVRQFIGNAKVTRVDIRGFGETALMNTLVMINGRRTNQIDMSGVDWSQIDIQNIERIEVVRGPQSVLYGDNAVGGVINIITKRGGGERPELGFSYEAGSYRSQRYGAHASGGTDFMDYHLGFSSSTTDGFRTNSELDAIDFSGAITVKPTDSVKVRFDTGYHKDWYGLPGPLTHTDIDRDGNSGSATPNDAAKTDDFFMTAGLDLENRNDLADVAFRTDVHLRGRRTASVYYSTWGANEYNNHIKSVGLTPKIVVTPTFMGRSTRTIVGIDYYAHKGEILSGMTLPKDRIVIEEDVFGVYATETIHISKELSANCGFRIERAQYRFSQEAAARNDSSKRPTEHAYEAGLNYRYNERSAIYANAARSYRFPAVDEWYTAVWTFFGMSGGGLNLELEPQTGMHYEVGIRENTLAWLNVNLDYFYMDIRHELYYNPLTFSNAIYDHVVRQGIEAEIYLYPAEDLEAYLRYTFENAFFVGSHYAGNEVPMSPDHKVAWGVTYSLMDCFDVVYGGRYMGDRHYISDLKNSVAQMKPFVVHDLSLAYHLYGVRIFVAVNNVFDAEYYDIGVTNAAGTTQNLYPSNRRNVLAGVRYTF